MTGRVARSKHSSLQHRKVSLLAEDQVVEQLDAQQFPRLSQSPRDVPVISGGLEVAARVVVGHDDGGRPLSDGFAEDLPKTAILNTLI